MDAAFSNAVTCTSEEQDWANWFNRVALEELANPVLTAPAVPGKYIAPGTPAQKSHYIHEFRNEENQLLTACVRAFRYRSIYGVYPDGSKNGPQIPSGLSLDDAKWLTGQAHNTKYLKWFRGTDPVAYAAWLADHPTYKTNVVVQSTEEDRRAA